MSIVLVGGQSVEMYKPKNKFVSRIGIEAVTSTFVLQDGVSPNVFEEMSLSGNGQHEVESSPN